MKGKCPCCENEFDIDSSLLIFCGECPYCGCEITEENVIKNEESQDG